MPGTICTENVVSCVFELGVYAAGDTCMAIATSASAERTSDRHTLCQYRTSPSRRVGQRSAYAILVPHIA
eukprot:3933172-Rhodomonas_salina.2